MAISNAVNRFRKERNVFPILVGMERLDAHSCVRISERLGKVPVFTSEEYNMFQLVSILRCCQFLISSRYHAVVTSMPGMVPSADVSMDQRIQNLMHERGHPKLLVNVTDAELEPKLLDVLERLHKDREAISDAIDRTVAKNIKAVAKMGMQLEQYVRRCYPEFPIHNGERSWEAYAPPLSASLHKLMETYGGSVDSEWTV